MFAPGKPTEYFGYIEYFKYFETEPPLTTNILLAKVANLKIKSSWYYVKILNIGSNTIGWKELGRYRTPPVPVGIIIISFFEFCFLGHRQKSRFFILLVHLIYQSNGFYDNQSIFFFYSCNSHLLGSHCCYRKLYCCCQKRNVGQDF